MGVLLFVLAACSADQRRSDDAKSPVLTEAVESAAPVLGTGGPGATSANQESAFAVAPRCGEAKAETQERFQCSGNVAESESQSESQSRPSKGPLLAIEDGRQTSEFH